MSWRLQKFLLTFVLLGATTGLAFYSALAAEKENFQFVAGFFAKPDFTLRDHGFSRLGRLEAAKLAADTEITALGIAGTAIRIGTSNRGIFSSADAGKTWTHEDVHQIPMALDLENQRRVYAFDNTLTFATHKHDILYRAEGQAPHWQTAKTNLKRSVIFTALYRSKNKLYLGTSVNGLQVAALSEQDLPAAPKVLNLRFQSLSAGLPGKAHDKSHFIYEEIQAINETPQGDILVLSGPRPALYIKEAKEPRFRKVETGTLSDNMDECFSLSAPSHEHIVVSCRRGIWRGALTGGAWQFTPQAALFSNIADYVAYALIDTKGNQLCYRSAIPKLSAEKKARMQSAAGQRLFYSSAFTWQKKQSLVLAELQHDFWTGIVLDGKDDNGYIRYDSEIPLARKIGAVRPLYKMREVIEKVHALKKRVVVRLVIFKDPKLFEQEGYAIRDAAGGKWIGTSKERWIDPYNPDLLTEYYGPMVQELTERGVDEIQLDYIRFPSDGAIARCRYAHKKSDHYASEALENFLAGIRARTPLPLSADIYGYNGMYRVPGAIGQDLEVYGRILDIISPMHYSSHFGDDYMREYPRNERAYQLLLLALSRGSFFAQSNFILRPWLQAFPMKNGLWGYGKKYFADQIRGSAEGGGNGFLFWGQIDHMIMVRKTQTE